MKQANLKSDIHIRIFSESRKDKEIYTTQNLSDEAYVAALISYSKMAFSCNGKALFGYLNGGVLWTVEGKETPESFYKELLENTKLMLPLFGHLRYYTVRKNPPVSRKEFKAMGWHMVWSSRVNGHMWKVWGCDYAAPDVE